MAHYWNYIGKSNEPKCTHPWTYCGFETAIKEAVNGKEVQYQFDGCWVDWKHKRLDQFETSTQTIWNLIRCNWRYKD